MNAELYGGPRDGVELDVPVLLSELRLPAEGPLDMRWMGDVASVRVVGEVEMTRYVLTLPDGSESTTAVYRWVAGRGGRA